MTRLQDVDSPDNPHTLNTALSQTIAVQTTAESGISKSSSNSFEGSHETEKEAIETIAKDDFPDGGLRAWFVVLASSFIMAMSFGMCNSFGVYQTYYEIKYPHVRTNILSIIGALQTGLTMFLAVPSSVCMVYIGPQAVVAIGSLLACLSFMFLSITKSVAEVFIVQGLMYGIGSGLMYVHSTGVTFQYFKRRKALAQGLITTGASLGGIYWPVAVKRLINSVGFAWANRIIGFIYLPMGIVATVFLKPRIRVQKRKPGENILGINFAVMKDWKYLVISFAWVLYLVSMVPGFVFIDLYCLRAGVSPGFQKYTVTIMNSCGAVFRILCGFFGDKFGRINITIPSLFFAGLFPLVLWLPASLQSSPSSTLSIVFVVLWSCFASMPIALIPTVIGQIFEGPYIYSYLSVFLVLGGIGDFLGPILGGLFLPQGNTHNVDGFDNLAIFCGVISLVSSFLMICMKLIYGGVRGKI